MPQPWVLIAVMILALQSCGGGGEMGPPEPPPQARAKGPQQ